jgi:hypothetical protein
LAELSGEIAGGLMNPEGLKEYLKQKKIKEALDKGESLHDVSGKEGYAAANTIIQDDKIVNEQTGEVIMDMNELQNLLSKFK